MALRFSVFLLEMKGIVSVVLDSFAFMILHNGISYRHIKSFWRKTRHERFCTIGVSLVAQTVKNLSAMQETQVWSHGGEDPLEKGMQPTPVLLPGEFHGQRSLMGCSPWGCKESDQLSN